MSTLTNRRWLLAKRPDGPLEQDHFQLDTQELAELGPDEIRVRVCYLSFDPTQRVWIQQESYLPIVEIGDVVRAFGVGQVVASNHADYKVGQLVQGLLGWQDYYQGSPTTVAGPIGVLPKGVSPEMALGMMGMTSITAWFGVHDVLKPKAGEVAVVSGAAGATGSAAGQILKAAGLEVIGIAGGPEKTRWVVETAGFDHCIDYKSEDVKQRIRELAPKGVKRVFENVGGDILDASLANLATGAVIAFCGAISEYDSDKEISGPKNYMNLVVCRARIQGFLVLDYYARANEAIAGLTDLVAKGQLTCELDIQEGFENIPSTLMRLFSGKNFGKQLLRIEAPPLEVV